MTIWSEYVRILYVRDYWIIRSKYVRILYVSDYSTIRSEYVYILYVSDIPSEYVCILYVSDYSIQVRTYLVRKRLFHPGTYVPMTRFAVSFIDLSDMLDFRVSLVI